ncbi:hypothetical protein COT98_00150 [Candidatus Falkowbacteria bacterium CG10_big_fil_rev_8_21_14_0_10_39_9]|uniref:phospholipase D n=1 Tax=Candidatus Falkowbacteria bacterium CG10_big_fil_rev_8_21_14_0_10_39_9 TaxID=1974566 RepID=A0A2M6WRJ1_9BACT|nr:MAG: hypothetical protein COT98_00150 [Candidatus Falkowbacteria bacterium CG10_big_fil_rev_8_21_14_0_10_39_9]
MSWRKLLRQNNNAGRQWRGVLVPTLALILVLSLLAVFFRYFSRSEAVLIPAKDLEITEPFSGELYFNDQLGGSLFSDQIIAAIDSAKQKIEVAVYSMDNTQIRDALYRAAQRGVAVSLVFSDKREDGINTIFKNQPEGIKKIYIASDPSSMHHKFIILDRGSDQAKLFFGSYNFTYLQEKYDPSFLLKTVRSEIITVFGEEFDRLALGQHGGSKIAGDYNSFAARINYLDGWLEIWFSPQTVTGSLRQRMSQLIKSSTLGIEIMIWNFTDNGLAKELAEAAGRESVKILTDDVNYQAPESAFNLLSIEKTKHHLDNLELLTDAKRNQDLKKFFQINDLNSFLHQHLMLLDNQIVIFGTNNWSAGGFYKNDESVMISSIPSLVSVFKNSFDYNYQKNK